MIGNTFILQPQTAGLSSQLRTKKCYNCLWFVEGWTKRTVKKKKKNPLAIKVSDRQRQEPVSLHLWPLTGGLSVAGQIGDKRQTMEKCREQRNGDQAMTGVRQSKAREQ